MLIHQRNRLEDVAKVFAHFAAVLVEDMAEAENALRAKALEISARIAASEER